MIGQTTKVVAIREAVSALPPLTIDLNDLLREVAPELIRADEMRKARVQLAKEEADEANGARDYCGLTKAQREALRAKILQWEAEAEWLPQSFVALEQVDSCAACGHVCGHLVGVYQHQRKRTNTAVQRFVLWSPEEATDPRVPRSLLTMERTVAMCPRCLWQNGFVEKYEGEVRP